MVVGRAVCSSWRRKVARVGGDDRGREPLEPSLCQPAAEVEVHLRVEPSGGVRSDDVDDRRRRWRRVRFGAIFVVPARDKVDGRRVRDRVARRPQLQVQRDAVPAQVPDAQERRDDVLGEGVEDEDAVGLRRGGGGGGGVVVVAGRRVEEADEGLWWWWC